MIYKLKIDSQEMDELESALKLLEKSLEAGGDGDKDAPYRLPILQRLSRKVSSAQITHER